MVHKSISNRINKEQPDVILITGDAIERNKDLPILQDFLNLIDYKIPKIAILGNKESSGRVNLKKLEEIYKNQNGILLINEAMLFTSKNRTINIIGLDDLIHGQPDFERSIKNKNKSLDTMVLNHCPAYRKEIDIICKLQQIKIKLILSGHTHGGQITFFGQPLVTPEGSAHYVKGWYNNEVSRMYVSKGVGTTVIPMRFGARAEASIFYI